MTRERYFFLTNDVETTSLWNHCLNDKTGYKVWVEGMPLLLDLYKRYNIKSTFFFTGHIAKLYPEIVKMIQPNGHEVGCHGMVHESDKAFDVLSLKEQIIHLKQAKEILEDISGEEVISFRAPAIRVNKDTPNALLETGFKIDSSIAPQRGDFIFSFGSKDKLKWLLAPRKPYITSTQTLARKGDSGLSEFPINAAFLPYGGTFMRISPFITRLIRFALYSETLFLNTPQSFIIHPNELIIEKIVADKIQRRAKNYFSYLLADKLRYKLKLKNLGPEAVIHLENQIKYLRKRNYSFITLKEYFYRYMN